MKFEKKQRNVVYVPGEDAYRALGPRAEDGSRRRRSPRRCVPGVFASMQYWGCFDDRGHCPACARAVKAAWEAGDRYMLDSEESRKAAELVADLAEMKPEPEDGDLRMALDDLYGAVADVLLSNQMPGSFGPEVLEGMVSALGSCLAVDGYETWEARSQRRKFMYALPRSLRTPAVYTVMGLYFGTGQTPLLGAERRKEFRRLSEGHSVPWAPGFAGHSLEGARRFFGMCLSELSRGAR